MAPMIDAHVHFWQIARGDYTWLTPDQEPIHRDFLPDDFAPLRRRHRIEGVVLVQAAETAEETAFLLSLAEKTPWVRGVVGWTDFAAPGAPAAIEALAHNPVIKGLRPMIQDIEDEDWMLRPDLDPAFRALIDNGLRFDALVLPRHLERLRCLLDRYPDLPCVIDHGAKPQIREGAFDDWAAAMTGLARDTDAVCKLSGLVTEAGPDWNAFTLKPYVDHLIASFGPRRLLWGSDWPVCTLAADYDAWHEAASEFASNLDQPEKDAVFGGNAQSFYAL